jgi:hypothetical protein
MTPAGNPAETHVRFGIRRGLVIDEITVGPEGFEPSLAGS